jgi:hypothetical protein
MTTKFRTAQVETTNESNYQIIDQSDTYSAVFYKQAGLLRSCEAQGESTKEQSRQKLQKNSIIVALFYLLIMCLNISSKIFQIINKNISFVFSCQTRTIFCSIWLQKSGYLMKWTLHILRYFCGETTRQLSLAGERSKRSTIVN